MVFFEKRHQQNFCMFARAPGPKRFLFLFFKKEELAFLSMWTCLFHPDGQQAGKRHALPVPCAGHIGIFRGLFQNGRVAVLVQPHGMVERLMTPESPALLLEWDPAASASQCLGNTFTFIEEGLAAARDGRPLTDNPHAPDSADWHRWQAGWFAAGPGR